MRGSNIISEMPEAGIQRESYILNAVKSGHYMPINWSTIVVQVGDKQAKIRVSSDGLRLGESGDNFRVSVTHRTAELIATHLGLALPTPKLSDEIWAQATVRIKPVTQPWSQDGTMSRKSRMIEQSQYVDSAARAAGWTGQQLVADVGKDWVTVARLWQQPNKAANYGWHGMGGKSAATPAGGTVIQTAALGHDLNWVDYSQVLRLIDPNMQICSSQQSYSQDFYACAGKHLQDVIRDPNLAYLVSHEGALPGFRHPGVSGDYHYDPQPGKPSPSPSPSPSPVIVSTDDSLPIIIAFATLGATAVIGFIASSFYFEQQRLQP